VSLSAVRASARLLPTPAPAVAVVPVAYRAHYPNVELNSYYRYAELPNCGGSIELKIGGGNANLIFRGVKSCSNFDILSNNGDSIGYANKKLGGSNGARGGSFTLPRRFISSGFNAVTVSLQSNSGKTRDLIRLHLWAY
jgi:hypothetical protein